MTDKDALSLCLWREARGEGSEGMLAVGSGTVTVSSGAIYNNQDGSC